MLQRLDSIFGSRLAEQTAKRKNSITNSKSSGNLTELYNNNQRPTEKRSLSVGDLETLVVTHKPAERRTSKVSFHGNVNIVLIPTTSLLVPHEELWWGSEELLRSKKECVAEITEIFLLNPSVKNGKQALELLMKGLDTPVETTSNEGDVNTMSSEFKDNTIKDSTSLSISTTLSTQS